MPAIDADAHVIETERTWEYMDPSDSKYRPVTISRNNGREEFWLIDGNHIPKDNTNETLPEESREMIGIEARLRHMDELGIDVQVVYPTVFIRPLTTNPEIELALSKSYNRWMAELSRKAESRLRWVAVLPTLNIDAALAEARFSKANGACGVYMKGLDNDKLPSDTYFYPLYEQASRLDMPICIHASHGSFGWGQMFQEESGFAKFKFPVVCSFYSIIYDGVADKFPNLRFGFIEVRAQWIPYVIHDLVKRFENRGREYNSDIMRHYRLYVTCQTDDDLPYVLKYAGPDNLLIGTDYGHKDTSAEIGALRNLKQHSDIDPGAIDKILWDNPKTFYSI
jgi:predicted TIM-barrel fold metal-dependent hydrolase